MSKHELERLLDELTDAKPKRGGGPRSAAGRAAVSTNALTHGLTSAKPCVWGEKVEEWDAFEDAVVSDLAPVGAVETELARRAALLMWRLRRAARVETAQILYAQGEDHLDLAGVGDEWNMQRFGLPRYEDATRYETTMWRALASCLDRLEAMQRRRVGELVPAPARAVITTD